MDLFELLLLFIFVVLPLLQGLFGKKGTGTPSPLPDEPDEWEWERRPEREPGEAARMERAGEERLATLDRRTSQAEDADGGWAEGWGAWPGATVEDDEEPVEAPIIVDAAPLAKEAPPEPPFIEPARSYPVVVSLERLEIDRSGGGTLSPSRAPAPPLAPAPRRRTPGFAALLHDSGEVRRAIVLAEVLGPPRALQSLEPRA